MADDALDEAFEEYDQLASNVRGSGYKLFENHLNRFVGFVAGNPFFAAAFTRLSKSVDFAK